MANILDKIIADKKKEVTEQKKAVPVEELKESTQHLPKCRNFYKEVSKKNPRGINVIAEVKKASPSAGVIREDFDPVKIAKTYRQCGADAISVLTDEKYFQGKLEYLTRVKDAVDIPVLRKDFIIDEYQVYESRAAGADAILLIADALKKGQLVDLMIKAAELSLTVLLEVHGADILLQYRSLIGFPKSGYSVMGINNRNLDTMKVDFNNVLRLAEFVERRNELIAESGIKTRKHVIKLIKAGIGGVLIGQTLCESEDITAKFKELFG